LIALVNRLTDVSEADCFQALTGCTLTHLRINLYLKTNEGRLLTFISLDHYIIDRRAQPGHSEQSVISS